MAFPARLLGDDEEVVDELRPHLSVLLRPAVTLVVVCGLAGYGVGAVPDGRWQDQGRLAVVVLALLLVLVGSVLPWLRWRTTSYVLTTERVITRSGVLARRGRDVLHGRVRDVAFTRSPRDRLVGCGTLVLESGGGQEPLVLADVPHVDDVRRLLHELAEDDEERRADRRSTDWEDR